MKHLLVEEYNSSYILFIMSCIFNGLYHLHQALYYMKYFVKISRVSRPRLFQSFMHCFTVQNIVKNLCCICVTIIM
jgi:hypothetical protein